MGLELRLHSILLIVTIFYLSYSTQGVLSLQYRDSQWNYNSAYSNSYPNHPSTYYRTENNFPSPPPIPETRTEYAIETVQRGSAYVYPRQRNYTPVRVGPDKDQTKHYFVRVNTTTHYLPEKPLQNPRNNQTILPSHRHYRRRHHRSGIDCVKCPPEKVIIAQKSLDGVLIDAPKLMSCHNRPILNGAYQIETLFGREFKFLLPHGTHSLHGKIRSKRNPTFEQNCILRYKVIVQQCGRFYPQNDNLRVRCDPGYIWGSKCYFSCRTGYLSHNEPMVCGDSLNWEGDEPECLSELSPASLQLSKSCDFIEIPEHGKFSCQYPHNVNTDDYENELVTPEGTICRVQCNHNYEIPSHMLSFSILRCENGRWNSTAQGICRPKYRY